MSNRQDILTRAGADEGSTVFPAYAWPGGYDIGYVTNDGACLCATCMNDATNPVHFRDEDTTDDGWMIVAVDCAANWDGANACDHCNATLGGE
jgi:hypothetical protein